MRRWTKNIFCQTFECKNTNFINKPNALQNAVGLTMNLTLSVQLMKVLNLLTSQGTRNCIWTVYLKGLRWDGALNWCEQLKIKRRQVGKRHVCLAQLATPTEHTASIMKTVCHCLFKSHTSLRRYLSSVWDVNEPNLAGILKWHNKALRCILKH